MPKVPDEAIQRLWRILTMLEPRSPERRVQVQRIAQTYGCAESTVYRQLGALSTESNRALRKDKGTPQDVEDAEFHRAVEIIAALKHRSTNKKGHHISTQKAIEIARKGFRDSKTGQWIQLRIDRHRATWDRWLAILELNKPGTWESPAVRFGATRSNEIWQFDISNSDAYYLDPEKGLVEDQAWRQETKRSLKPRLKLYAVIDDFSRVEFMKYYLGHGEDPETALRFFYEAMASKADPSFPFEGLPDVVYMDNGPIARSAVFRQVMKGLGIKIRVHETPAQAKGRTAARSKGKIERSFRTVKASIEALFKFHRPGTLDEANEYLLGHSINVAYSPHPILGKMRIELWHEHLGSLRRVCDWEEFIDLARTPKWCRVNNDCYVRYRGEVYEVDSALAGKRVEVWRGAFDHGLYVRGPDGQIYGPSKPNPTPIAAGTFKRRRKRGPLAATTSGITLATFPQFTGRVSA